MTYSSQSIQDAAPTRRSFMRSFLQTGVCLLGLAAISMKAKALTRAENSHPLCGLEGESNGNETSSVNPQVPYIYWTWGEVRRGDCTISPGAMFQLFADGSTRWKCDIRSSDSGDEWDGRFEILNQGGQVLAATPGYHFDISQENVTKHWEEFRGPNASLAAAYPQARSISFYCSC